MVRRLLHMPALHAQSFGLAPAVWSVLHGPCFRRWQKKRNNCPVCRARMETLDSAVHKTETLSLFELLGVGVEVLLQLSEVGSESASASTTTATTTIHDEDLRTCWRPTDIRRMRCPETSETPLLCRQKAMLCISSRVCTLVLVKICDDVRKLSVTASVIFSLFMNIFMSARWRLHFF